MRIKFFGFPLLISSFIFLIFQLQVFAVGINFRDEGFLTYNAVRIGRGELPYRDFFLTTTPGTYYIQAFLMNLFGSYLVVGRVLYIFFVGGILYLVSRFLRFGRFINVLLLSFLAVSFIGPSYAFYNVEALFLFLVSFVLVSKNTINATGHKSSGDCRVPLRETRNDIWISCCLLGVISAGIFLLKQSYGVGNLVAIVFSFLWLEKDSFFVLKRVLVYVVSFATVLTAYLLYLVSHQALSQFIYYVFSFSREVKSHRDAFIYTAVLFIPAYLIGLHVLRKVSLKKRIYPFLCFVICGLGLYFLLSPARIGRFLVVFRDPLVYYYLSLLIVPLTAISFVWRSKFTDDRFLVVLSFFSLVLFLSSAASGRDYTTVLMVSPFFLPLCVLFLQKYSWRYCNFIIVGVIILYTLPFLLQNLHLRQLVNRSTSSMGTVKESKYLMVPKDEALEVQSVVKFIQLHVPVKGTIICFPYCPLLYVLAERGSASYFSFYYPETFRVADQERVISDIKGNKPKMIILQRKGNIEPEAEFENVRLAVLRNYFFSHYSLVKTTMNFALYVPKR